jgi:hypothetical protein
MNIREVIKFRASGAAPLFLGTDGLTEAQRREYDSLLERQEQAKTDEKKKLTDKMKSDLARLKAIDDCETITLSAGAKTYVEELINEMHFKYRSTHDSKEKDKGTQAEEEGIEVLNALLFTNYQKSDSELIWGNLKGHPDIEDDIDLMIADIKCSWTKKTFPKLPRHISNSTYEWQLKLYCYMKSKMTGLPYRKAMLAYVLVTTPEELIPDYEDDSLHYMEDLDLKDRVTRVEFELTDADIAHIERRVAAALDYAELYYNELLNKNKI